MKKIALCCIAAALPLIMSSCSKNHDGHDHKHDAKTETRNHENGSHDDHDHEREGEEKEKKPEAEGLELTSEQLKLIGLKTAKASPGQLENTLRLDGEIKYNAEKIANVMPRLPGFVSRINATEGQKVKKGEILAILQSQKLGELYSDYNANLELEKLNLSEYRIAERLYEKKAMSEIDYLKAKRQYADTQIARRRAEAILKSLGLDPAHSLHENHLDEADAATVCTEYEMKSPLDGVIITRDITPGENYAEDNTKPSFVVADTTQLWLELRARQDDLPHLRIGQSVNVNLGNGFQTYHGKIAYIAPALDETTRTAMVRVILDNVDGKLKPGLFAVGSVVLDKSEYSVLVPRVAVQMIEGENMVFVPSEHGYITRNVKLGRSDRNSCEIVSGLKPGEEYVTNGAFELKSMIVTAGMDAHAGHGH